VAWSSANLVDVPLCWQAIAFGFWVPRNDCVHNSYYVKPKILVLLAGMCIWCNILLLDFLDDSNSVQGQDMYWASCDVCVYLYVMEHKLESVWYFLIVLFFLHIYSPIKQSDTINSWTIGLSVAIWMVTEDLALKTTMDDLTLNIFRTSDCRTL
jgi:hypothetical protein